MKMSRMVITTELPSPHFEDEETIVSARPVVPIARARVAERSRLLLFIVPTLIAAAVVGGVGALGVNYLKSRNNSVAASQPPVVEQSQPVAAQPTPNSTRPVVEPRTEVQPSPVLETPVAELDGSSDIGPSKISVTIAKPRLVSAKHSEEPSRLVRKRKVVEPSPRPPQAKAKPVKNKSRGAAGIEDIFGGPNPR